LLFLCVMTAMAGCAGIPLSDDEPPDTAIPEAEPSPPSTPTVPEEPETRPAPEPEPPLEEASRSFDGKAAIVLSGRSPSFDTLAHELGQVLDRPLVYDLSDKSQPPEDAFADVTESGAAVVIAIGHSAAEAAMTWSTVPVVYCQVFNFRAEKSTRIPVKGVAAIPPLSLQVVEWLKADPELRRIGAILGDGHESLVAEAKHAANGNGLGFHYQSAASDRETIYLFKRMAPDIDGFWLFPDNRILSIPVLKEMVDVANRHGVRIAVFNEALLELGVALSTAADVSEIAETAVSVAQQVVEGRGDSVPDLTPLRSLNVRLPARSSDDAKAVAVGGHGSAPNGRL
jgi:ABC transporter substrate binding protein